MEPRVIDSSFHVEFISLGRENKQETENAFLSDKEESLLKF